MRDELNWKLRLLYLSNQDYNRFKSRLQIGQRKPENTSQQLKPSGHDARPLCRTKR